MTKPLGEQFVRVFHSSESAYPPHEEEAPYTVKSRYEERSARYGKNYPTVANVHPDVIHAGTRGAATEIGSHRPYMHMYDIPVTAQYPVTFGDSPGMTFEDEEEKFDTEEGTPEETGLARQFQKKMRGVQQGLFETTPGDPRLAVRSNLAVPYRNKGEDEGSISWMIPKGAVKSGRIKYAGLDPDYISEAELNYGGPD